MLFKNVEEYNQLVHEAIFQNHGDDVTRRTDCRMQVQFSRYNQNTSDIKIYIEGDHYDNE